MPTPTENQMIQLLTDVKSELVKIANYQKPSQPRDEANRNRKRNRNSLENKLGKLADSADGLNVQINETEKAMKYASLATSKLGNSFSDVIKEAIIPGGRQIKATMTLWKNAVDSQVKNQATEYRDLARNAQNYLRTNADATNQIRLGVNAYRSYLNIIKKAADSRTNISEAEAKQLGALQKHVETMITSSGGKLNVMSNNIKMSAQQQKDFQALINKGMKLDADALNRIVPVLEKIGANFEVVSKSADGYAQATADASLDVAAKMRDGWSKVLEGMRKAVKEFGKTVYSDLQSQMVNHIPTSNYGSIISGNLGVSQAQLSDFIAQNRSSMRMLGGDSLTGGVSNGSLAAIQDQVRKTTGLIGEDAQKYMTQTFKDFQGLGVPVTEVAGKFDSLQKTMQVTDMNFNEFNGMVSDLAKSPAFIDLVRSNGYNNPEKEISIFTRIMQTTGYSANYLKEILDINKQSKYQGIAEMVKAQVGLRLETNLLNRNGGNISAGDQMLESMRIAGKDRMSLYDSGQLDNINYNGKRLKDVFKSREQFESHINGTIPQEYNDAYNGAVQRNSRDLNSNPYSLGLLNTFQQHFGGMMGPGNGMFNTDEFISASANRKGRFGSETPSIDVINKIIPPVDKLSAGVDKVNNAFQIFGPAFNDWITKLTALIRSLGANPLGMAAGGIGTALQGLGTFFLARSALGKLGSALPGLGGAAGGGLISRIGGGLMTGARALGPIAGIAGMGLGGAAIGGGLFGGTGGTVGGGIGGLAGGALLGPIIGRIAGGMLGTLAGPAGTVAGTVLGGLAGGYVGHKIDNWMSPSGGSSATDDAADAHATAIASAPLTADGKTQGDLMTAMIDLLTDMRATLADSYDLEKDNHDQYMEWLAQNGKLDSVNTSRGSAFGWIQRK
jgi:hypothetical protein